ncbi:methylthioribose kinase [compost metagenome]
MESYNKSKLTDLELESIVKRHMGQSIVSSAEMSDGWANTAYSIKLGDDRQVVLKVAPSKDKPLMRCEKNNMRTEVEALRLVGQSGDVPVPLVYAYDPSGELVPYEYFIMEHIQGTPFNKVRPSLSPGEIAAIEEEIGVYSRRINTSKGTSFGLLGDSDGKRQSWTDFFQELIEGVLSDGEEIGVVFPVPYAEMRQQISRQMDTLDEVKEPCLVHWDLWDGNVFVHEGRVTGIIDFERAFWGDPLIEFYFGRFSRTPAFEQGYGRTISTDSERRRRVLYNFYLDLILVIESYFRQYEDQNHINWTLENFETGYNELKNL